MVDLENQVPVTTEILTLSIVTPLRMVEPSELITIGKNLGSEFKTPITKFTGRLFVEPLALPPDVATFNWQGSTRTLWLTARGEPAGKVDTVTAKMQEPNVVVPVAVALPVLMAKAGLSPTPVKVTVVGVALVPKSGTPAEKVKGWFVTAAAVLAVTGAEALLVGTNVVMGADVPPPPHAAKAAEASKARNSLLALIINSL